MPDKTSKDSSPADEIFHQQHEAIALGREYRQIFMAATKFSAHQQIQANKSAIKKMDLDLVKFVWPEQQQPQNIVATISRK